MTRRGHTDADRPGFHRVWNEDGGFEWQADAACEGVVVSDELVTAIIERLAKIDAAPFGGVMPDSRRLIMALELARRKTVI